MLVLSRILFHVEQYIFLRVIALANVGVVTNIVPRGTIT